MSDMTTTLQETPRANRIHLGFFGKRNSGKSSLVNALAGHNVAVVSDTAGTTTDPVYKSMEIKGLGPCVLIDTAGFDDEGALGDLRVGKTADALEKSDLALLLFTPDGDWQEELRWFAKLRQRKTPTLTLLSQIDTITESETAKLCAQIARETGLQPLAVSALNGTGVGQIRTELLRLLPEAWSATRITGGLVENGDLVLLVTPQDIQAPQGRLILPQVQTMRELLDMHCLVMCVCEPELPAALAALKQPPALIITDSQVFPSVYAQKPKASKLTSFSVLFAAYKGDLPHYVAGAKALDALTAKSRVLIAEACTHAPLREDIGREKIPRLLRNRVGDKLQVDHVAGSDFPSDLTPYDLIIHCGGCMFNRKYLLARVAASRTQGIPMTNYGVAIAHLSGILEQIDLPQPTLG